MLTQDGGRLQAALFRPHLRDELQHVRQVLQQSGKRGRVSTANGPGWPCWDVLGVLDFQDGSPYLKEHTHRMSLFQRGQAMPRLQWQRVEMVTTGRHQQQTHRTRPALFQARLRAVRQVRVPSPRSSAGSTPALYRREDGHPGRRQGRAGIQGPTQRPRPPQPHSAELGTIRVGLGTRKPSRLLSLSPPPNHPARGVRWAPVNLASVLSPRQTVPTGLPPQSAGTPPADPATRVTPPSAHAHLPRPPRRLSSCMRTGLPHAGLRAVAEPQALGRSLPTPHPRAVPADTGRQRQTQLLAHWL